MFWPAEAPHATCSDCGAWEQLGTDGNGHVLSRGRACTCSGKPLANGPLFKPKGRERVDRPVCIDCGAELSHQWARLRLRCKTCAAADNVTKNVNRSKALRDWCRANSSAGVCVVCGGRVFKGGHVHDRCMKHARRRMQTERAVA